MKTNLLDNALKHQLDISVSHNSSFICISNADIADIEHSRVIAQRAFDLGDKLNIKRYLFDVDVTDFNERFVTKCDFFYNLVLSIAPAAEKIALLQEGCSNSNFLLKKLLNYYMDNFKIFRSKKSAVDYLVNDTKTGTHRKLIYPCSAIPRFSTLEFSVNKIKSRCVLCMNTEFRFDPYHNSNQSFKCMKCGAEYSLSDFSYTEKSKFDFNIIS